MKQRMFDFGKRLLCSLLVASSLALVGLASCTQAVNTPLVPRDSRVLSPRQTGCGAYPQGMLRLEETRVLPEAVIPGNEVSHRMRYAFCPAVPAGIFKGSVIRTVLFKGKKLFHTSTDYELKPGTWIVDAFIGIPKEAQGGAHALEVVLKYADQTTKETKPFMVKGN